LKAGRCEEVSDCGGAEFVTILGVDGLSGLELEGEGGAGRVGGDMDVLIREGFEVHLHAGVIGVPKGAMGKAGGVEVGGEVAVEAGEDVAIEFGGDSSGVIVRGEERLDRLVPFPLGAGREVSAKKERISGAELGAEVAEEIGGLGGGEVADAGADVEGKDPDAVRTGKGERLGGVVGDLWLDGDAGDVGLEVGSRLIEGAWGDIYGLVEDASLPLDRGGEEDAGLGGGACAEFKEGEGVAGSGDVEDLVRMLGEDGAFGAGEVVLGKSGDLLEEVGAAIVVEEPGGEGSRIGEEASSGLGGYGVADRGLDGGLG